MWTSRPSAALSDGTMRPAVRDTLHRVDVHPGDVFVAHAGVPHYLGPRILFAEVQEPSDHLVIAETDGSDDAGATMGLGWDVALTMIEDRGSDRDAALARARQPPVTLRTRARAERSACSSPTCSSTSTRPGCRSRTSSSVADGRFSIAIVVEGDGTLEGEFGSEPVGGRDVRAGGGLPAPLASRARPLTVLRCMGPVVA